MYGIIYKATGPSGLVYVGQTVKSLTRRKANHAYRMKKGDRRTAFHVALLDEGFSNFTWEQIDQASTQKELNQKEIYWINRYKATDPAHGYNRNRDLTNGHTCFWKGKKLSETHRQKIAEAMKGNKNGKGLKGKGYLVTQETHQKLSLANKGKKKPPRTEEHRRNISRSLKGNKNRKCKTPWNKGKQKKQEGGNHGV
jgi:group I intron endonuclease